MRKTYPDYYISKNKIKLEPQVKPENILNFLRDKYSDYPLNNDDGLRIDLGTEWVHVRKSNTEPILRIYAEGESKIKAEALAKEIIGQISNAGC